MVLTQTTIAQEGGGKTEETSTLARKCISGDRGEGGVEGKCLAKRGGWKANGGFRKTGLHTQTQSLHNAPEIVNQKYCTRNNPPTIDQY